MGVATSCLVLDTVFSHWVVVMGFSGIVCYAVHKALRTHTALERATVFWLLLTATSHAILSRGYLHGHREMRSEPVSDRQAIGALGRWAESPLRLRDCFVDPNHAAKGHAIRVRVRVRVRKPCRESLNSRFHLPRPVALCDPSPVAGDRHYSALCCV